MIHFIQQEKEYRKLFAAGVLNGIGDRFSQVAVLALLLQITGSGYAVGLTLAIRVIPFLLFAPIGGWLSDKISKKKILVYTDLIRIFFALSFLFAGSEETIWIIYAGTFMLGAGEAIYAPTRKSFIPQIVSRENLIKANSLEQVMVGVILIAGSLSGGAISYFFSPNITFLINGLSFFIAAIILSRINKGSAGVQEEKQEDRAAVKISTFLFSSGILITLLIAEIIIPLLNGIDNVLISVYAIQEYQLGDMGVGLFYGALGMGLILSFAAGERLQKNLMMIGIVSIILEGALLVLLSQLHAVPLAVVTFIFIAFFSGVGNTCFDSVLMQEVPAEKQGKVFGLFATISNSLIGLSMFTAGITLEFISNRLLGFIGGAGFILTGFLLLIIYLSIRRRPQFIRQQLK